MTNEINSNKKSVPKWIEAKLFENILQENVENYKNIIEFNVKPAMKAGENYATNMLKVEIVVELQGNIKNLKTS